MEKQKSKRKAIVLLVIALIVVVGMIAGATYAYFQAQSEGGKSSDVNVTTGTTDSLKFFIEDINATKEGVIVDEDQNKEVPITINASMENFAQGEGKTSLGDGVKGTIQLTANDTNNSATRGYYVYLKINSNELRYTTYKDEAGNLLPGKEQDGVIVAPDETHTIKVPELILTIKKTDKATGTTEEITSGVKINGEELTHVTNVTNTEDNQISGFDITDKEGLILIKEENIITNDTTKDQELVTKPNKTTHEWEITVTFINLDSDQNLNTGKKLEGHVIIQQEVIPTNLADVCSENEKASDCVQELYTKSDYKLTNIVYHNTLDATEKEIPNASKVAGDDSYRYVGANPNNYVCFGTACSNEGTDPNYKNLYRIIGFFKNEDSGQYEMKIIKADAATKEDLGEGIFPDSAYCGNYGLSKTDYTGKLTTFAGYYWNDTAGTSSSNNNVNMWAASNLNTKNLNGTYYDAIDPTYQSMVVEHKWEVGGTSNSGDAKAVYDSELGDNKLNSGSNNCYTQGNTIDKRLCSGENDLTYTDQVGLMYISDYMYGTLPEYWTTTAYNYQNAEVKNNDWLYIGLYEWTISRLSSIGNYARLVYGSGCALNNSYVSTNYGVRPVLYLTSDVKIIDGSGTDSDPFMLSL